MRPSRLSCRMAALLLAAVVVGLSLVPSAQARPGVGISDQNLSMFSNPLFPPLGIKYVRYILPWDIALQPDSLSSVAFDQWLAAAQASNKQVLVAFEHSAGDNCPHEPCTKPSEPDYARAIKAFRAKYPTIRYLSPWNEANAPTQPTYRDPVQAVQYFKIVKQQCRRCTIVAADVLDNSILSRWIGTFASVAESQRLRPRLWGLHNWGDVNHFQTDGVRTVLDATKGSVWLTETGGIVSFQTADGRQNFHPSDARATKAMRYLFRKIVPISKRIKRIYVYNWLSQPANRWDTGLLDHGGHARTMYRIVDDYIHGR
ncbi:glycosyl hydrolase [Capillimicrobium parvum]|uniref:glycosyl hydrolase n=1 Tax=Capillimicrobium parvum TaxID=2884022 RepID=UPI00216B1ED7|nr:glycosyl hydrolase [Capillimicrobium parvum]